MNYRILLTEDDDTVRAHWKAGLQRHPQLQVSSEADSLSAARRRLRNKEFDLVLLDLGLPDGDGLQLIDEFRTQPAAPQVLVLTCMRDEAHIVAALAAGAVGYLLKDQMPDDLGKVVLETLSGGSVLSPAIARYMLSQLRMQAATPQSRVVSCGFTPREREILQMVAHGLSYTQVAAALGISFNTVATHIQHLYRKLDVRSRGEAVATAVQRGLVDFAGGARPH